MEVQILVEYKGATYESNIIDVDEKGMKKIKNAMLKVANGECTHFSMETGKGETYFPRKVLDESVISIYCCE